MKIGKLLIDGDILVYRVGYSCNDEPIAQAKTTMDRMIGGILMAYPEIPYKVYLSGPSADNYRHSFAVTAPYKGNRTKEKPVHYQALRDYLLDEYMCTVTTTNEADDAISIDYCEAMMELFGKAVEDGEDYWPCIVSVDKDFDQLIGCRYDFVKGEEVWKVGAEGNANLYRQVMEGDVADNVKGIPGVGPVKARKALEGLTNPVDMYNVCIKEWMIRTELNEAEARLRVEENLNLLFLQRKDGEFWCEHHAGENNV